MNRTLTLATGTVDEYFARSKERARKLDRGEKIEPEFSITFEDPTDLSNFVDTMTTEDYPIQIRKLSEAEGGGYLAEFPDLPGCIADGETPEEAYQESRGALASYLTSLKKHDDPD